MEKISVTVITLNEEKNIGKSGLILSKILSLLSQGKYRRRVAE